MLANNSQHETRNSHQHPDSTECQLNYCSVCHQYQHYGKRAPTARILVSPSTYQVHTNTPIPLYTGYSGLRTARDLNCLTKRSQLEVALICSGQYLAYLAFRTGACRFGRCEVSNSLIYYQASLQPVYPLYCNRNCCTHGVS